MTGKQEIARLEGHRGVVLSVAFRLDELLASAGNDGTVRLWDVAGKREITRLEGHKATVWSVSFSLDGTRVLTGSWGNTARLWDAATGRAVATLAGHTNSVSAVAFSPDGTRIASSSADGTMRLWDAVGGNPLGVDVAGARGTWLACVLPDQRCWRADDGTLLVQRNANGFIMDRYLWPAPNPPS